MVRTKLGDDNWHATARLAGLDGNALDGKKIVKAIDRLGILTQRLDDCAAEQSEQASIFDADRFIK